MYTYMYVNPYVYPHSSETLPPFKEVFTLLETYYGSNKGGRTRIRSQCQGIFQSQSLIKG